MPSPVPPEDFPLFPAGFASFLSALPYAPSRIRTAHRSLSPAHLRPSPCRRKTRMPLPARQTPRPPSSSARKPAPPPSPTRHRKKASRPFARHAAYPGNMPFSGPDAPEVRPADGPALSLPRPDGQNDRGLHRHVRHFPCAADRACTLLFCCRRPPQTGFRHTKSPCFPRLSPAR